MADRPIRYTDEQGLYYRKPYIKRKFVASILAGLLAGNILGCAIFSFYLLIIIVSLILGTCLILIKRLTDGRMDYRNAEADTSIIFESDCVCISHTFTSESVEMFKSTLCDSNKDSHTQTYQISYENICHVFWYEDSFVVIVNYPCSDIGSGSSSGIIYPLTFNCPLPFYNAVNDAFYSHLRKYPQHADLDYIVSYINAIR